MKYLMSTLLALTLLSECVPAQEEKGRLEVSAFAGAQAIGTRDKDNRIAFEDWDNDGYIGLRLLYGVTSSQSIGIRYGNGYHDHNPANKYSLAAYNPFTVIREKFWMFDLLAVYRYTLRARMPTRLYFEVGGGIISPFRQYDSGIKGAITLALGLKRYIGENFSVGLEMQSIGFRQRRDMHIPGNMTVGAGSLSVVVGRLF